MAAITGTSQGDYDGNGTIEANDYNVWKANFGTANVDADGNGNGIVDAADYTIWRDHLGQTVGSGSSGASPSTVPEPSSLICLLIAGLAFACRRRNR